VILVSVHDTDVFLLLLLLGTVVILLLQGLRLRRHRQFAQEQQGIAEQQRQIAIKYEAAAVREEHRQVASLERAKRAVVGEWSAPALLENAGYEVLARQVDGSWMVHADGQPRTFKLRADYLVRRLGRRYIAEVKTGRVATRLSHGATRRQLLEYWAAFDVEGVLLVDADRESITHVELDPLARLAGKAPQAGAQVETRQTATRPRSSWTLRLIAAFSIASFIAGLFVGALATK
jgi:hypothetical protein